MKNFLLNVWYNYKTWRYERKCIKYFGAKPETIYLSAEDFDTLIRRMNEPLDPAVAERIKDLMNRRSPWD